MGKNTATGILLIMVAVLMIGIILFADKLKTSGMSLSEIIGGIRANVSRPQEKYVPDEILIRFNPDVDKADQDKLLQTHGLSETEEIPEIKVKVLKVNPKALDAVIEALSHNPNVEFAEKNVIGQVAAAYTPNDPYFTSGYQWGLNTIKAPDAWGITKGSTSTIIAILDTGIQMNHPDLTGKIVAARDCTGTSCISVSTSSDNDVYGHGTHTAGIAAVATDNSVGVSGMGFNSKLNNVKVCTYNTNRYPQLQCLGSSIAKGIIWAADNGAKVISMSVYSSSSSTLENAINYAWNKDALLVCAAGNNGDSNPVYPAAYQNCIAVAGTNQNDQLALLSNYGKSWVDVAAPGFNIYSTTKGSGYGYKTGTSMATAYVSGLAGLLFTKVTDTNGNGKINDEVRSRIESTCDKISIDVAYGRINAYKAVTASSTPSCTETDGGVNYYLKGTVTYGSTVNTDSCSASGYLFEQYCLNGRPVQTTYWCSKGCANGACIA